MSPVTIWFIIGLSVSLFGSIFRFLIEAVGMFFLWAGIVIMGIAILVGWLAS